MPAITETKEYIIDYGTNNTAKDNIEINEDTYFATTNDIYFDTKIKLSKIDTDLMSSKPHLEAPKPKKGKAKKKDKKNKPKQKKAHKHAK